MPLTYKQAGVDLEAAAEAKRAIRALVESTHGPQVLAGVGHFGGLFRADFPGFEEPILVSSVDGVGTKLKIAFMVDRHDTIGEDLVNHCVNDILTLGATPLFFLDYLAMGRMDPRVVKEVVEGLTRACRQTGCALIGGETAEMPGFYAPDEYDLAGTIVGIVDRKGLFDGSQIQAGDVLIGLASNGLHTNGYSLARKVFFELAGFKPDRYIPELQCTLAEELLRIHRCYLDIIRKLMETAPLQGMAHITGGGLEANVSRILPQGLKPEVWWGKWEIPPIFQLIQRLGKVPDKDMRRTFNLGIGYVLVVRPSVVDQVMEVLQALGEKAVPVGEIVQEG